MCLLALGALLANQLAALAHLSLADHTLPDGAATRDPRLTPLAHRHAGHAHLAGHGHGRAHTTPERDRSGPAERGQGHAPHPIGDHAATETPLASPGSAPSLPIAAPVPGTWTPPGPKVPRRASATGRAPLGRDPPRGWASPRAPPHAV